MTSKLSIILADSEEEVNVLAALLGVTTAVHISELANVITKTGETIVWAVMTSLEDMNSLVGALSLRRGVLSVDGKMTFVGYNSEWMKLGLMRNSSQITTSLNDRPSFEVDDEEKDDPYSDLGYTRR